MWFGRKQQPERAGAGSGLREQAFSVTPGQIGLDPSSGLTVWALIMETGYEQAVASLVTFRDGTTSLYFSNGGGVIGAGQHQSVQHASRAWLDMAETQLSHFAPAATHPLPSVGRVRIYARTFDGLLHAEAAEDDLGEGRLPLSPLFHAGHRVLTEIRLHTPGQ